MNQRKPWLPTVIMGGIAVLVIAFSIWIVPLLQKPPESSAQPTSTPLWDFSSSDLVSITVVKGLQTTTVERSGMAWQVVAPMPGEADIIRLYNLADAIANMVSTRALDSADLVVFGLDEPAATVTLGLQNGTTLTLEIGDQNPSLTDYYVQKEGDPRIHLVASTYIAGLLDLVDNPPYPATAAPPPSPVETPTPGESPVETPAAEGEEATGTATTAPTEKATETATPAPTEEPTGTPASTSAP
ncbi:MAG: DUF4340 domain-containing protein [Anaerolineae bacterium]|nr:DUF4340 domain-containing protein [Anaerolineae bacterium]